MTVAATSAVRNIPQVHLNVARNFGLSSTELMRWVVLPAVMPQLFVGLRITPRTSWAGITSTSRLPSRTGR